VKNGLVVWSNPRPHVVLIDRVVDTLVEQVWLGFPPPSGDRITAAMR
jgi:hypothetical protein